ncbi:ABC transporter ATP-binding protein, partial [Candidatus Thorarchaeota archaeon]
MLNSRFARQRTSQFPRSVLHKEVLNIYAVELENISKTFPGGVQANKNITLRVEEGEVHGLLGENGAGKSTLMNILYGFLNKDRGRIIIKGEAVEPESPIDTIVRGIGMVHQHFKLIPPLTVTENVILGMEPIMKGLERIKAPVARNMILLFPTDFKRASDRIREIAKENGMAIDPDRKIEDLSIGLRQRVEIVKTLYRDADILILDEPTSVLTPQEVDELFVTLERFREAGKTIILITHKLRETMALCDRITVLRDGQLVGTVDKEDTSPEELAKMMVGRPVVFRVEKPIACIGEPMLQIDDLVVKDNRGIEAVKGISLQVCNGEILGIAGVEGNGQTELVEALAGLRKPSSGHIMVRQIDATGMSPRRVRDLGVAHIPEDRQARGLILGFTVAENLVLGRHHKAPFADGSMIAEDNIVDLAKSLVSEYDIKVSEVRATADTLSGGNQQKLVV